MFSNVVHLEIINFWTMTSQELKTTILSFLQTVNKINKDLFWELQYVLLSADWKRELRWKELSKGILPLMFPIEYVFFPTE